MIRLQLWKMPYYDFFWTDAIIEYLGQHDVTPADFERVATRPERVAKSNSSDREVAFGYTEDGRFIIAIY